MLQPLYAISYRPDCESPILLVNSYWAGDAVRARMLQVLRTRIAAGLSFARVARVRRELLQKNSTEQVRHAGRLLRHAWLIQDWLGCDDLEVAADLERFRIEVALLYENLITPSSKGPSLSPVIPIRGR